MNCCLSVEVVSDTSETEVSSVAAEAAYTTQSGRTCESKLSMFRLIDSCTYFKLHEISGGDALRGDTRSHPEHDG